MKNFLAHKPSTLSKELSEDFNHQRLWAKHYLSSYKDYLISDQSNNSVPPPQFKVAVTSPKLKNPSGLVL